MSANRPTDATKPVPIKEEIARFRLAAGEGVCPYGIGAAWLGQKGTGPEQVRQDAAVLHRALELGFRYFDTSAGYGESEIVVGAFLADLPCPRESIFLATKSGIPKELTPEEAYGHVGSGIEASLRRLRTEYIDLFQIHDVYTLSQFIVPGGALDALKEAKRAGKIRYFGLATRPLDLLKQVMSGRHVDTVLTYSDYTPIDQSAEEIIRLSRNGDTAVVNASPLSAGVLAGPDPRGLKVPEWHDESVLRRKLAIEVYDLCVKHGVPILAAALQYPLRSADISMNLTGPGSEPEILSTLEALRSPIPASFWAELDRWNENRLANRGREPL